MMDLNMILIVTLFWIIYFVGLGIGYVVPEKLVKPLGFFDFKPMNCRKCMTCQSLAVLYASAALCLHSWVFFLSGLILSILQGIAFIITDREKGLT